MITCDQTQTQISDENMERLLSKPIIGKIGRICPHCQLGFEIF